MRPCFPVLLLASLLPVLRAQDTRQVSEPVIPPVCATLPAMLHAAGGVLAAEDEARLDTVRIQKALDHCGKGKAVELAATGMENAFLTGPLDLREGTTLVVGKGATLLGSRDPRVYETSRGSCGVVNDEHGSGCRPLIRADHVAGAGVMGDGVIDGRGGATLLGGTESWWQLAEDARPGNRRQQVPRILVANYADEFTVYRVTLRNSPNFHITYNHGNGFTVWGLKIDTAHRQPNAGRATARNTDGVDPGGSKNITITQSYIRTGDDNVAIKGGDAISNVTIAHNHFYYGHGMSIGSETNGGVSRVLVTNLSLDGTDSGIRIKSTGMRGGMVRDIVYEDVCIRNSPNPISIDAGYTANGPVTGNSPPTFRDITLRDVRVSGGGKITFNGYDHDHRAMVALDGVTVDGAAYPSRLEHANVRLGPGTNLRTRGGHRFDRYGYAGERTWEDLRRQVCGFPGSSLEDLRAATARA